MLIVRHLGTPNSSFLLASLEAYVCAIQYYSDQCRSPDILVKLSGVHSLSFTNISGGAARHEKVSPKTWRILAFADAIWFLSLQVFTTDQPRSRAFKNTFAPLFFAKKFLWLGCFREKNQR